MSETILRAYQAELDLTVEQRRYLERCAGVARVAYNWALAEWRRMYRRTQIAARARRLGAVWGVGDRIYWQARRKYRPGQAARAARLVKRWSGKEADKKAVAEATKRVIDPLVAKFPYAQGPSAFLIHARLTAIKSETFPWMADVSAYAVREAVADVGKAHEAFFRRVRKHAAGDHSECGDGPRCELGAPRFKSKRDDASFHVDQGSALKIRRLRLDEVRMPGLGQWLRTKRSGYLPTDAKICGAGFRRWGGKWYVSVRAYAPKPGNRSAIKPGSRIGVELGVRELAVVSTGKRIGAVRDVERIERALQRRKLWERRMARRWVDGRARRDQSAGWHEAKREVAKYHRVVAQLRTGVLHYASSRIVDTGAETIALRDMRVRDMIRRDNKRDAEALRARNAVAPMVTHVAMYELRRQVEYKQAWRGGQVVLVPNDEATTRRCSACGEIRTNEPPYGAPWRCQCGASNDRELNAAINIRDYRPPSGEPVGGPGTRGRKTDRKVGTTAARSGKPGAVARATTDGPHGDATSPLGAGNGTAAEQSADEKGTDSSVAQPGSAGEPAASDRFRSAQARERGGDARSDHEDNHALASPADGPFGDRSQTGSQLRGISGAAP